jgi:hypothetical protein
MEEREIHWTSQLEEVMAKAGEECRGYAWIHNKSESIYSRYENMISLPVIVLSAITGFLSASTGNVLPISSESSVLLGGISLTVSVLQAVSSKYAWAKRCEGHRVAYLSYSELFNFIDIEMKLPRDERMRPNDLIKMIRETMKRLAQTSPPMPQAVLRAFHEQFKEETVNKPAETNGLSKIVVYQESARTPVFKPTEKPNIKITVH